MRQFIISDGTWKTQIKDVVRNEDVAAVRQKQGWLKSAILGRRTSYKDFIFLVSNLGGGGYDLAETSILALSKAKLPLINVN